MPIKEEVEAYVEVVGDIVGEIYDLLPFLDACRKERLTVAFAQERRGHVHAWVCA